MMQKIIVIGSPGAGKSTFARKLRDKTGLPLHYLDTIWHRPDRTNITRDEFDSKLADILKTGEWIIDGNYGRTLEMRLKACDTVFLLDYPLDVCLAGAQERVGQKREEMPWIEEELDEEFRQWIEDFPNTQLPKIYQLLEQYKDGKQIYILHSRADADDFLRRMQLMAFDFKKEYREFYMPKNKPSIVTVPVMNYIAVRGKGDPNQEDGEYKQAIGLLYGIAFTIKMSKKGDHQIEGYFDYVVPPLEGFWWQDGVDCIDYAHKENFKWISVIRLPDFVTKEDFEWAIKEATRKKKADFSKVEFFTYREGLCVQCMHIGSYDDEPATVALMHEYIESQGYSLDITNQRMHHEIYLSDARKVAPEKLKTVIRHPIKNT